MPDPAPQKPRPFRRGYDGVPDNWEALSRVPWGGSVIVEVGCGTGEWVLREAGQNPGTHYIGIEQTANRSGKLLQHAKAAGLPNLTAIRADAVLLLDRMCPPGSVDAFYFFYPNPYPKSRQANKRFFVGSSFDVFDRCLKLGGTLYVASNIADYIAGARRRCEDADYRILRHGTIVAGGKPRTAFEKKYLERNEKTFELTAKKPTR